MPPKKRKSTASSTAGNASNSSAKRARKPVSDVVVDQNGESEGPTTPGEEKRRGRSRRYPADATTKPTTPDTKRGRGRPNEPVPNRVDDANPRYKADENGRQYWLMKAEPESRFEKGVDVKFSIDDLKAATEPEPWDGVRNFVARNHMRAMKKGDYAFFYHSSCKVPGIVGYMEIVQEHSPDESAFDPAHPYYDEKSNRDNPKWSVVQVEFRRKFDHQVTLNDLKSHAADGPLQDLQTLKQSRLSVSSVTPQQWEYIMKLAEQKDEPRDAEHIGAGESRTRTICRLGIYA